MVSHCNMKPLNANNVMCYLLGEVNAMNYQIALSASFPLAKDAANSTYFALAPLTATQFMVMYYIGNPTTYTGPLSANVATVSFSSSVSIAFSVTSTLSTSSLNFNFAATALDNNTVLVVYTDALQDNAVVTQVIQVFPMNAQVIVFGAQWMVNSGAAYAMSYTTGLLDLDIRTVSSNQEFVVLYSDISNSGAITASFGQKSTSGQIVRTAPDFVLTKGNSYDINTVHVWGSIAAGKTDYLASQTVFLTMIASSTNCGVLAEVNLALLERLPSPVGILTEEDDGDENDSNNDNDQNKVVALPGSTVKDITTTSSSASFVPSQVYYTTTKGQLVTSRGLYPGGWAEMMNNQVEDGNDGGMIYDPDNKVFITAHGQVGIAINKNTLFVQTN